MSGHDTQTHYSSEDPENKNKLFVQSLIPLKSEAVIDNNIQRDVFVVQEFDIDQYRKAFPTNGSCRFDLPRISKLLFRSLVFGKIEISYTKLSNVLHQ